MSDELLFPPVRDDAPVDIVPYDARWPDMVDVERALLLIAIGQWLTGPVEHIGSTAVPGLSAKPTIDIMAAVESLEASRAALPILETYEYRYAPYRTDVMHWFCKPSPAVRTHHLHLVPFGSRLWEEQLAFRDYLRAHTEVAQEYGSLKRRLAAEHRFDREAYTDAKAPFVNGVLDEALRSGFR